MATYRIDSAASKLIVTARSTIHDTKISWHGISGTILADANDREKAILANIKVDMRTADAGDWLKNRKLRKDMQLEQYPLATFVLDSMEDRLEDGEKVSATVVGTLCWRGKSLVVTAQGAGRIGSNQLRASGTFDINMTRLGIAPPKILMIKIEDTVNCHIELQATIDANASS